MIWTKRLIVVTAILSNYAIADDRWLCIGDGSVGFEENSGEWNPKIYITSNKFIITKPSRQDIELYKRTFNAAFPSNRYLVKDVKYDIVSHWECTDVDYGLSCDNGGFMFSKSLKRFISVEAGFYIKQDFITKSLKNPLSKVDGFTNLTIGQCTSF